MGESKTTPSKMGGQSARVLQRKAREEIVRIISCKDINIWERFCRSHPLAEVLRYVQTSDR